MQENDYDELNPFHWIMDMNFSLEDIVIKNDMYDP